mmetsp:Transcript_4872/g.14632  ORF Transcript_4872/g.14632 Transcript_4872/m.14632 type:complete len:259 (+) Transcript_4872:1-777(+)
MVPKTGPMPLSAQRFITLSTSSSFPEPLGPLMIRGVPLLLRIESTDSWTSCKQLQSLISVSGESPPSKVLFGGHGRRTAMFWPDLFDITLKTKLTFDGHSKRSTESGSATAGAAGSAVDCAGICGLKMLILFSLPLTRIGLNFKNVKSLWQRLKVVSSTRTLFAAALLMSLAERLTVSPITVYSRRVLLPTMPQYTRPVVMPMRPVSSICIMSWLIARDAQQARRGSSMCTSGGKPNTKRNSSPLSSTRNLLRLPSSL